MLEASHIVAFVAVVLLVMAAAVWLKLFQGRELHTLPSSCAVPSSDRAETAARVLVWAVGVSATAAVLAVTGWFAG